MDSLPQNFFSWYFAEGITDFLENRQQSLGIVWRFINVFGLLRTLFSPYRRMQVEKESKYGASTLIDRIIFNLISRFVGAGVRITLILAGLVGFLIYSLLLIPYSLFFLAIPIFSLPRFSSLKKNTILQTDLASKEVFLKKVQASRFFKHLILFFDDDFLNLVQMLEDPPLLGVKPGQKISEVFIACANSPAFQSYLAQKSIKGENFTLLIEALDTYIFFKPKRALAPLGQTLSFGYTRTLEKFARAIGGKNLFLSAAEQAAIEQIEKVLTRPKNNNLLLVGEVGVGRHATVENLGVAIANSNIPSLSGKQLVYLDTIALAGSGKNLIEVKKNFESVLVESKGAGNVILVIDQIDKIVSSKDGRLDLTEVLSFALAESQLPLIGITAPDDFNQYIRPNAQLTKFFEKVDLEEPDFEGVLKILVGKTLNAHDQENISANLSALVEIIERSNQLITERKQPEKALILFDEVKAQAASDAAEAKNQNSKITKEIVDQIISQKTKTPLGVITKTESQKLKNLENILHKRIIGQNEAIDQIASAMRRARAEIENTRKPIGSFLFLGPTGVGKTETAKALAEAYFGSEDKMVRFDMSEYQGADAISRLIGEVNSKSPGLLASQIRDHSFGILLLDEFEKANPNAHNLFLQILDEGFMTDAFGKKVSFDNIIIIATSNAGSEFIREQGPSLSSKKLVDYVLEKGLFAPELVNRFDGVVVYHPLTQDEIIKVTQLMLANLSKKLKESKNIMLEVTEELAQKVATSGFDPQFGARPIKRLIADKIEDQIAKMIIDQKVKNGDKIPALSLLQFIP